VDLVLGRAIPPVADGFGLPFSRLYFCARPSVPTGAQTMMTSRRSTFLVAIVLGAPRARFSQCLVILCFMPLFGTIIGIPPSDQLLSSIRERSHGGIRVFGAPATIRRPFPPQSLGSVAFSQIRMNIQMSRSSRRDRIPSGIQCREIRDNWKLFIN
jgi:hypothetical protein